MKTTFLKPVIFIMVVLLLPGCTGNSPTNEGTSSSLPGAVKVSVTVGNVGTLAKRTTIEMKQLVITISVKVTDSVVIADTSSLSVTGESTVSKTFPELTAPEDFKLSVQAIDAKGKTIFSGSKEFNTIPEDTVDVALDLDAKFSMLKVSFDNIPDSVAKVTLGIAGADTLDSAFTTGSNEKVLLAYDYLAADTAGVNHKISLKASGSFYGNDTVLYAADTAIIAKSGVDSTYTIVLKWVGPDIPYGAAEITVTIGAVGTTKINAGFGANPTNIPTDKLTAYLPFNGNVNDISNSKFPSTNHGTSFTTDRFGKTNAACSFNGTSNYIDLGTANPVTGNHFTISTWVSVGDTIATPAVHEWSVGYIIAKGKRWGKMGTYSLYLSADSINKIATAENTDATFAMNTESDTIFDYTYSKRKYFLTGTWHNVTGVLDNNKLKLYIDGQLQSYVLTTGQLTVSNWPLTIGRQAGAGEGNEDYFRGLIDDIRIYDRVLTDVEIQALYHENGWIGN